MLAIMIAMMIAQTAPAQPKLAPAEPAQPPSLEPQPSPSKQTTSRQTVEVIVDNSPIEVGDDWQRWFNGLLVVLTALQAFIAWKALAGVKHAADGAEAAKTAAIAAVDGLELARDTAKRQLRAYVGTGQPELIIRGDVKQVQFVLPIVNSGQSPALNVMVAVRLELRFQGDSRAFEDPVRSSEASKTTLTAGGTHSLFETLQLPPDEQWINAYDTGIATAFLHGRVDYEDIFGEPHRTTFRLRRNYDDGQFVHMAAGNVMT